MVQRYNELPATREAEDTILPVKLQTLLFAREMREQYLDSTPYGEMLRELGVFQVFDEISKETINSDVKSFAEVLKAFGTPQSYHDLARVAFPNYVSSTSTSDEAGNVEITVTLGATNQLLKTENDQAITTHNNQLIETVQRVIEQNRNDYSYLIQRLSPPDITATAKFL